MGWSGLSRGESVQAWRFRGKKANDRIKDREWQRTAFPHPSEGKGRYRNDPNPTMGHAAARSRQGLRHRENMAASWFCKLAADGPTISVAPSQATPSRSPLLWRQTARCSLQPDNRFRDSSFQQENSAGIRKNATLRCPEQGVRDIPIALATSLPCRPHIPHGRVKRQAKTPSIRSLPQNRKLKSASPTSQ